MNATRFLWITDPWDTLDHPRDTTLRWAEESLALGYESHWCDVRSIRFEGGKAVLTARRFEGVYPGRLAQSFRLGEPQDRAPADFDSVHYRTDPPVDLAYLHPLQLVVQGLGRAELVNPARVLFEANEKLEGTLLPDFSPPTLASSDWERCLSFGERERQTVLKPLHQAQSKGVELLSWETSEGCERAREKIRSLSADFTLPVLLQKYLPGIAEGEQRLWYVDGKLLAIARKKPKQGDYRIDMDQGGTLALTELTRAEKKAAQKIGVHLKRRRIRLAAVDLIEGLITDFNFTSPGLIPQMEALLGRNLAKPILEALAKP